MERVTLTEGQTVDFTYTTGFVRGQPREYWLVVDTYNSEGEQFSFTYTATAQDDAGLGKDATYQFREGDLLFAGTYEGFLGDEDEFDWYKVALDQGQEVTMTLVPKEPKASMRLQLIDESLETKINERTFLETGEIIGSYISSEDQVTYVGVEGNVPYTLTVELSGETAPEPEVVTTPPEPEVISEPVDPEPELISQPDPDPTPEPEHTMMEAGKTAKGDTLLAVVIVILLVAAGILTYFRFVKKK